MENIFVTITGINHYYGKKPFEVNRVVKLVKEPKNPYDAEAIGVYLPFIDKIGSVANSANTVYGGTSSAGRIWDKIEDNAFAQVLFVTHSSVIAVILPPDEAGDDSVTTSGEQNADIPSTSEIKSPLAKIGF